MTKKLSITLINIQLVVALLFANVLSIATPVHAAAAANGMTTPQEMETFLDGLITAQMKADHVPGVVVTVVKNGQVFFIKGYGYSNVADQIPVSPERTLFRIGSTSKLFVWTAVMQLVDQGKLDLDADVNSYLDFKIPATYPEPIKMKDLLTHTPGFEESNVGLFVYTLDQLTSLGDFLKTHLPARVFPPGKIGAYSNYGAALAGYIVERISGMSFDEYAEKNIFAPLGMRHTTFRQPLPDELAPDTAGGYNYLDGKYKHGGFELVNGYPAGSVSSTAADMAKFMIAHLQNGSFGDVRILSNSTAQQMHGLLESFDPRFKDGMAYGFVRWHVNGQLTLWHNGDTSLFHTGLHLLPDQNLGFFISNNGFDGGQLESEVFQAFMDHYYPAQPVKTLMPLVGAASRATQYAGEYYSSRSDFTGLEKIVNIFSPIQISADANGYVLFPSGNEMKKYVEVEPGLLQSVENPWKQAALKSDSNGQFYLLTPGPAVLVKASWYQTQLFHLSILGLCMLVFLFTLLGWLISFIRAWRKRQPQPLPLRLAQISGTVFIFLLLVFLAGVVYVVSQVDLVSNTPLFVLEVPTALPLVLAIPPIMVVTGILLLVFTLLTWVKRLWSFGGRLHYTLLTIAAWVMLWELVYWNFLKV
jgi:CubicO group peptidase (beta-lactamase class C family)